MNELEVAAMQELNSSYAIIVDGELSYQRQAMFNMFRKGAEWQAKQSPWVSVEEGYPVFDPDDHKRYIVKVEFGSMIKDRQTAVTWMANKFKFAIEMDWVTVTHWMEIPE